MTMMKFAILFSQLSNFLIATTLLIYMIPKKEITNQGISRCKLIPKEKEENL